MIKFEEILREKEITVLKKETGESESVCRWVVAALEAVDRCLKSNGTRMLPGAVVSIGMEIIDEIDHGTEPKKAASFVMSRQLSGMPMLMLAVQNSVIAYLPAI